MSLMIIGTKEAYEMIDRKGMYNFLLSLKDQVVKGAIRMEPLGEYDMRAAYCALAVSKLLNILDEKIVLDTSNYI